MRKYPGCGFGFTIAPCTPDGAHDHISDRTVAPRMRLDRDLRQRVFTEQAELLGVVFMCRPVQQFQPAVAVLDKGGMACAQPCPAIAVEYIFNGP